MPAPTALMRAPEALAPDEAFDTDVQETTMAENINMDVTTTQQDNTETEATQSAVSAMSIDEEGRPRFAPVASTTQVDSPDSVRIQSRKVPVPPHRMSPLKSQWSKIYPPLVEHLKLQVRMNIKSKAVELRTSKFTTDTGALQKGEDFVRAFCLGFDVDDSIALLRLDDLYIETFEIKDVKTLNGEHLGRGKPTISVFVCIDQNLTYM
jgi:RNA-binding protein PNO1